MRSAPTEDELQAFLQTLQESERTQLLRLGPAITTVVVGWTVYDALMVPELWSTLLMVRLGIGAVSAGLFYASWRRLVDDHLALATGWVFTLCVAIGCMLVIVDSNAFLGYLMGGSLCALGGAVFTLPPRNGLATLGVLMAAFLPGAFHKGWDEPWVVSGMFFLVTLVTAMGFQVVHRYRRALDSFRTQRALEDASRAKSAFLANMSHELRTPLNAILGYAELVREEHEDDQLHEDVGRIEQAGKHLLALIDDVLDLSKVASGQLTVRSERFDIVALVREIAPLATSLAARNGNRLRVEDAPPCWVRADRTRVRQIVLNLLSNASKFTNDGVVSVRFERSSDRVAVAVLDTGIGMDAKQLSAAFEPFVQVHREGDATVGGTGLGLAVSRELAVLMDGGLTATSERGVGTEMVFELPRTVETAALEVVEPAPSV